MQRRDRSRRHPAGNTPFSVPMYGVYEQAGAIIGYRDGFERLGLPLAIDEFGHHHPDDGPDVDTIRAEEQARGVGSIVWSCSGTATPWRTWTWWCTST